MLWDLLLFTIDHILFLCALPTLNVNAYVMQLSHFYCIYEVLVVFFCQALSRVMNSVLQRFDGVSHLVCELCIVHRIEVQVDIVQLDTWYLMRKHSL
jgi:hypothetical protein